MIELLDKYKQAKVFEVPLKHKEEIKEIEIKEDELEKEILESQKKLIVEENKEEVDRIAEQNRLVMDKINSIKDDINNDIKTICKEYNIEYNEANPIDFVKKIEKFDSICWSGIPNRIKLSESFIRKFQDKLDWCYISADQELSEDFIREFQNKVIWGNISIRQKLSEKFIEEFADKVNWTYIFLRQNVSLDFMEKNRQRIDWDVALKYDRRYITNDNWDHFAAANQYLIAERFKEKEKELMSKYEAAAVGEEKSKKENSVPAKEDVEKFKQLLEEVQGDKAFINYISFPPGIHIYLNKNDRTIEVEENGIKCIAPIGKWINISKDIKTICEKTLPSAQITFDETLSDEFLDKFKEKLTINDWGLISDKIKLSEDFIREFQDKLDWICVSYYQELSEEFIREFKNKVYWNNISYNQKLSEEFIKEFKDDVNWNIIYLNQELSFEFMEKFKQLLKYDLSNPIYLGVINDAKNKNLKSFLKKQANSTFWGMTKSDASKASYRIASKQITKGAKALILSLVKKQNQNANMKLISDFLDSEYGSSIISMLIGYGLTYTPAIQNNIKAEKLAKEFRVNGMATAGNAAFQSIIENILPVINDAMKTLPEQANQNQKQEELEVEIENVAEEIEPEHLFS